MPSSSSSSSPQKPRRRPSDSNLMGADLSSCITSLSISASDPARYCGSLYSCTSLRFSSSKRFRSSGDRASYAARSSAVSWSGEYSGIRGISSTSEPLGGRLRRLSRLFLGSKRKHDAEKERDRVLAECAIADGNMGLFGRPFRER